VKKALLVLGVILIVGCETREDFPPLLPITPPPSPTNLVVESYDPLEYDLTWQIDDPNSDVREFWVWAWSDITLPETVGVAVDTFFCAETNFQVPGLVFGVSAVSDQNVASNLASAAAPDTLTSGTSSLCP
jgi:hypothetical protein